MAELFHALGIEWPILIAQVVNFAILLVVLWKFVYTPVMRLLDARREGVLKAIERVDGRKFMSKSEGEVPKNTDSAF